VHARLCRGGDLRRLAFQVLEALLQLVVAAALASELEFYFFETGLELEDGLVLSLDSESLSANNRWFVRGNVRVEVFNEVNDGSWTLFIELVEFLTS
jgi:hypothetical protein